MALRGAVAGLSLGCGEQVERRSDVAGPGCLEPAGRQGVKSQLGIKSCYQSFDAEPETVLVVSVAVQQGGTSGAERFGGNGWARERGLGSPQRCLEGAASAPLHQLQPQNTAPMWGLEGDEGWLPPPRITALGEF